MRYFTTTNHDSSSPGRYLTEFQVIEEHWSAYEFYCKQIGKIAFQEDCLEDWCQKNRASEVSFLTE